LKAAAPKGRRTAKNTLNLKVDEEDRKAAAKAFSNRLKRCSFGILFKFQGGWRSFESERIG
jgi:hypothetical protein